MTQRKSERPIEGLACIVLFDDLCYDVFQHLSTKRHKVRISGGDLRRPAKYQVARTRNSTKLTGVCPRRDPLESGRYAMIIRNAQGVFHHIQTSINIVRFRFSHGNSTNRSQKFSHKYCIVPVWEAWDRG